VPQVFRVAEREADLLTRGQGELVRAQLVELHETLAPGERLTIDFAGVSAMTPSFADECFGKLAERLGANVFRSSVRLVGADEVVRVLVNSVLARRLGAGRKEPA